MVWGGHGHNHWHVRIGATYRLLSLPDLKIVRVLEKVGYCFFDQTMFDLDLPGAPVAGGFRRTAATGRTRCAPTWACHRAGRTRTRGRFPTSGSTSRVSQTGGTDSSRMADPNNWFRETNERNNTTWVDIELRTSVSPPHVKVLSIGPHGTPGRT